MSFFEAFLPPSHSCIKQIFSEQESVGYSSDHSKADWAVQKIGGRNFAATCLNYLPQIVLHFK